jgi:hypothetical protein
LILFLPRKKSNRKDPEDRKDFEAFGVFAVCILMSRLPGCFHAISLPFPLGAQIHDRFGNLPDVPAVCFSPFCLQLQVALSER